MNFVDAILDKRKQADQAAHDEKIAKRGRYRRLLRKLSLADGTPTPAQISELEELIEALNITTSDLSDHKKLLVEFEHLNAVAATRDAVNAEIAAAQASVKEAEALAEERKMRFRIALMRSQEMETCASRVAQLRRDHPELLAD